MREERAESERLGGLRRTCLGCVWGVCGVMGGRGGGWTPSFQKRKNDLGEEA